MNADKQIKGPSFFYILIRVILFCFALMLFFSAIIIDIFYPFFWEQRYNNVVMKNLSDDQIEFVAEQSGKELPINTENIELKWTKDWENRRVINCTYETDEAVRKNIFSINLDNGDGINPIESMVLEYGKHQALPLIVELCFINVIIIRIIVAIIIIIRKKSSKFQEA